MKTLSLSLTTVGLCSRAHGQSLGKISYAWLSYADDANFGPLHPNTLELHRNFLIEIDSAKTGKQATPNPALLQKLKPKYMMANAGNGNEGNMNVAYDRQFRSRLLGELFDMATNATRSLTQKPLAASGYDKDIETSSMDFLSVPIWNGYFDSWEKLYQEYRFHVSAVLNRFNSGGEASKYHISAIKQQFRDRFDADAEQLYEELYVLPQQQLQQQQQQQRGYYYSVQELYVAQNNSSNGCNNSINKRLLCDSLNAFWNCHYYLSSAVYCAVYNSAKENKLSFCWEICGHEINAMKALTRKIDNYYQYLLDKETEEKYLLR